MAGLDQREAVAAQEVACHRDLPAVRHHAAGVLGELLDKAVDVVPAAAVEPGRMVLQLPQDLVHLESGHDRLDQHRGADRALWQAEFFLRMEEHVVPQPRFQMTFDFRQVEIGAGAARPQLRGIVEKEQAEIEQRPRHRRAVDQEVLFRQMPAARAHEQHRRLVVQRIVPARFGVVEGDRAPHRVDQIRLAVDHVVPGRRVRVLKIGHEHARPAVERVDHHLAVGRAGDFDAAVLDVVGDRRRPPVGVADRPGLGQKIGLPAAVERRMTTLRALLFDLDGTLVDSEELRGRRKSSAAARTGSRSRTSRGQT